jgi:hypothetical protein
MFSLRAKGFSCSLDVLYRGLGIRKFQFLIKKRVEKLFSCIFSSIKFLVIKILDPYPDQLEVMDPDSMNPDP